MAVTSSIPRIRRNVRKKRRRKKGGLEIVPSMRLKPLLSRIVQNCASKMRERMFNRCDILILIATWRVELISSSFSLYVSRRERILMKNISNLLVPIIV